MKFKIYYLLIVCLIASCKKENLKSVAAQKNHFNHQVFEENKLTPNSNPLAESQEFMK